jgi:NADPH:quinone reductase-like Zn-dependent oxidoreductase
VLDGLSAGALRPIIAKTFPIKRIADAHRYLESNEQFGKIVVSL